MRMPSTILLALAAGVAHAAEWTWTWIPAPGDAQPAAEVTTFKYGKDWAYAIEIDDGPTWVRSFAVPFLAVHAYTDAPPGVSGGRRMPFVGSVAVIAANTGFNDGSVGWDDLRDLIASGWGVMNHSLDHRGYHWKPEGRLDDAAVAEDAYWSQALLAAGLPGSRAPTAAVYANGYVDYNRGDALARAGIGIATRVGSMASRIVTSPQVRWMDFPRSHLDEGVWAKDGGVLAQFPGAAGDGPDPGSLVIDFTHDIARDPDSANQRRWRERLQAIAGRWGAGGSDRLWCAPTAEIADYVHAAAAARISVAPGRLTIALPAGVAGSALTVRITGVGAAAQATAPDGGTLHRHGDALVVTTPCLGTPGSPAPAPAIVPVYDGPAVDVDLPHPARVAGIMVGVAGRPATDAAWSVALRTASGPHPVGGRTLRAGSWVVGGQLCAIAPHAPPVAATGVVVQAIPGLRRMVIWAIAE